MNSVLYKIHLIHPVKILQSLARLKYRYYTTLRSKMWLKLWNIKCDKTLAWEYMAYLLPRSLYFRQSFLSLIVIDRMERMSAHSFLMAVLSSILSKPSFWKEKLEMKAKIQRKETMLELSYCKKRQKKVPSKKLVWGIGDFWRFWQNDIKLQIDP